MKRASMLLTLLALAALSGTAGTIVKAGVVATPVTAGKLDGPAFTLFSSGTANAATRQPSGPCDGASSYIRPAMGLVLIHKRVRQLEHCIEARWPVPGGFAKLDAIVARESGRYPWAKNPNEVGACHFLNPYGSCGLGQHLMRYWLGRVRTFLPRSYYGYWPFVSPLNARANLIVTVRYVRRYGWGAWGG